MFPPWRTDPTKYTCKELSGWLRGSWTKTIDKEQRNGAPALTFLNKIRVLNAIGVLNCLHFYSKPLWKRIQCISLPQQVIMVHILSGHRCICTSHIKTQHIPDLDWDLSSTYRFFQILFRKLCSSIAMFRDLRRLSCVTTRWAHTWTKELTVRLAQLVCTNNRMSTQ